MFRSLLAAALLVAVALTDASAQARPGRAARKKLMAYSTRGARRAPNINPHTGKPYGAGVPEDIKNGTMSYLAPTMAMRKQVGYRGNGGYDDTRAPHPVYKKPANSSLNRDNSAPAVPAKAKGKRGRK